MTFFKKFYRDEFLYTACVIKFKTNLFFAGVIRFKINLFCINYLIFLNILD
ncbi:hypothetical protein LEP1GSC073_3954 [Leptospira noguchii str. Cascata]|nr:hypothetical protein LEP1GSC073_3954 [Leptospira noguchii str. Cascata]